MQTCTECGAQITPAVGPPVLNDGNVVCQPCWQRLEAESSPPAGRPASGPASRAGSAMRRAGSAPPSPTRRSTASATPAARRSSTRDPAPPARTSRTSAGRGGGEHDAGHPYRAPSRTAALIEEVEHSTTGEKMRLYILIAMCVMVIAAAITGYIFYAKNKREAEDARRAEDGAAAAMAGIEELFKKDPNNFAKIKDAILAAKDKVRLFPERRAQLQAWEAEVGTNEAKFTTTAANLALLEEITKEIEDPSKRQAVQVKLERAKVVAPSMPKEYQDKVKDLLSKLTLYGLKDGVDAAKAKEATGDLNGALSAYDEAVAKFTKHFDSAKATPDILNLYKELIAESDRLVERVETPDFDSSVPERDMLSAKERKEWGASAGAELAFSGREVELKGVDTGKKILGVVSFGGWNPAWQDVVIEMNFTIISGSFELYTRYWPSRRAYQLNIGPKDGYELNKPYQMTIRVKGSKIDVIEPEQPVRTDTMDLNTSRTGGVGFALAAGSKVILSSFKVKVLRPRT
jgi:flagellar basal body-associated protein FliL